MKKLVLFAALFAAGFLPKLAHADFSYAGNCQGSEAQFVKNGRFGKDIKPSLNVISQQAGGHITLYSCYRSPSRQDAILRANHCAPRFGTRDCRNTHANHSKHTSDIAADMESFSSDKSKMCRAIAAGRSVAGGYGGVGVYSGGTGHFDMSTKRAWGRCGGIIGNNDSYKSAAVAKYKQKKAAGKSSGGGGGGHRCHPTRHYPNCCGPIRAARGLCEL